MNIEITGRHERVTDEIQRYAAEKAEKIAKFLGQNVRVEVILDHEHDAFQAEVIVSGYKGPVIVSHVQHDESRAAVDHAIEKILHQLRKLKGRRKAHQGESMAGEESSRAADQDGDREEGPGMDDILDEELNR